MDCRPSRTKDPDKWIATCPGFTRDICEELRDLIFRWEPDLTESINSNMLCFSVKKRVVGLGAFIDHVEITFYRGAEVPDPASLFNHGLESTAIRGIKLTSLAQLPRAPFKAMLHAAMQVDAKPAMPAAPKAKREPWPMPAALEKGLQTNKKAGAFFQALKPTYQREYMVWVGTAKLPETVEKRLQETLAALAAGHKWAQRREAGRQT